MPNIVIQQPNLLLVEGNDEYKVFSELLLEMGIRNLQIHDIKGKNQLQINLEAVIGAADFPLIQSLGIIRDADDDPAAAFQSIQGALQHWNLPIPTQLLKPIGTDPRVQVLLLPGDNQPGSLETLYMKCVAVDPAMECVEKYLTCLEEKSISLPKNVDKTRSQAFLASRKDIAKDLGVAAQKGHWNFDAPAFDEVKAFIMQLVKPEAEER